ncbi:MAG: hypothetical protein DWQ07_17670 [Chloroflexi bacterium]|nr:MAG: hypothetical protein DWQ07_17670 [Chloroflexota bacterium]
MYITLRKGTHAGRPFLVRIYVNNAGPNRMLEVERAGLRCTCDIFIENSKCRHVKECQPELMQWQTRQLRKLRRQSTSNATIENLCARFEGKLPHGLQSATIIPLPDGTFALQWDTPAAQRYADGCSWGTGGRMVVHIIDWPEIAVLHLLHKEPDYLVWHWEIEERLLMPHSVTALPPRVSDPSWQKGRSEPSAGDGLFDLLDAEKEDFDPQEQHTAAWARFWAASCGLHLAEADWNGKGRYLPAWHIGTEPVVALALDLKHLNARGLIADELDQVRQDIPAGFQTRYGHVHRPWGEAHEDSQGYQVVICNANNQPLKPHDNPIMLTTNVWAAPREMHASTEALFNQVAEILLRMGQEAGCYLYHGSTSAPVEALSQFALVSDHSSAWDIPLEGWKTLQDEIMPALAAEQAYDESAFLDAFESEHWAQVVPPC